MTLQQLSDLLGVSPQAIRQYCKRKETPKDPKGNYIISKALETEIITYYRMERKGKQKGKQVESFAPTSTAKDDLIAVLKAEVEYLQKQLETTTNLLNQQQQLSLLDKQKIVELESKTQGGEAGEGGEGGEVDGNPTAPDEAPQATESDKRKWIDKLFRRAKTNA